MACYNNIGRVTHYTELDWSIYQLTLTVFPEHIVSIKYPAGIEGTLQHCILLFTLYTGLCIDALSSRCVYRESVCVWRGHGVCVCVCGGGRAGGELRIRQTRPMSPIPQKE